MPLGAKLVLSFLAVLLILNMVSVFVADTPIRNGISIVVQIALLAGLYDQRSLAWHAARWLAAFAIALGAFALTISAFTTVAQSALAPLVLAAIVNLGMASGLFYLLGRGDSRAYFNAPRKT